MILGLSAGDGLVSLADLFLPRVCPVCGCRLALRERHICTECLSDLPRTYFSGQSHNQMADRFNALLNPAPELVEGPLKYSYATALFFYRAGTGYRNITKRLKYHSDLGCGEFFADLLAKEMAGSNLFKDVDAVVPVPLHWTRRLSRGYNQAEIIARVLAARLEARFCLKILERPRKTRTQTRLSIEEKVSNVSGAFRLRRSADLSGVRHVLLVDDVYTTGATLRECFRALGSGVSPETRISVATLACVGL